MTFALSVNDFVDKVGAYAGIAAVVGLALFALLLFAQARELRRLREWGAHAHDRIGELERRLAAALELARRAGAAAQRTGAHTAAPVRRQGAPVQPAAPAAPAQAAVASTKAPIRLPLLPAAPVGVGGAALGSATVFVPLPKGPPAAAPAAAPVPAQPTAAPQRAVPAAAPAAAAAVPLAPATAAASQAPPAPGASPAPPAPFDTNGHSDTFPPVPPPPMRRAAPPRRPPARRPAGAPARPGARRPAPAAPLRASTPSASPRGTGGGAEPPHRRRRLAALLGGLGALTVVAVVVLVVSGGDDSPSTPAASTASIPQQTGARSRRAQGAPAAPHDRTTVAVLNGTTVPGLANTVASELEADGFLRGPVGNASDQGRSVTVVSYFGGREREAAEVAETLGVPSDAVQAIDADTEASCAATGGTCAATVVVTVGADRQ